MSNTLNVKTPTEAAAQARKADYGLSNHGIGNLRLGYWNVPKEGLYEEAVFRNEAMIASGGALITETGKHTGRAGCARRSGQAGTCANGSSRFRSMCFLPSGPSGLATASGGA
jgi:hypothetical protein